MNHSIYSADRATHLKIVVIALIAGITTAGVGVLTHVNSEARSTQAAAVFKAGKPVVMTSSNLLVTR